VQEARLALLVRLVAQAARDERDLRRARADEAADEVARGAPGRAVVQPHECRALGVRQVGDQRDHRQPARRERGHRLAHRGMLQRHHRDAVAALAVLAQRVGQFVRVEALDEHRAAAAR
jgi:hypothetical protein